MHADFAQNDYVVLIILKTVVCIDCVTQSKGSNFGKTNQKFLETLLINHC